MFDKTQFDAFNRSIEDIEVILNTNSEYHEKFNQRIDVIIAPFQKWKSEVNEAYKSNLKINKALTQLCKVMVNTADVLGDYCHYTLYQSLNKIHFNSDIQLQINSNEIRNTYETLMKHYTEQYVLQIDKKDILQPNILRLTSVNQIKENKEIKLFYLQDERLLSYHEITPHFYESSTFQYIKSSFTHIDHVIQLRDGRLVVFNSSSIKFWNIVIFECIKIIPYSNAHYQLIELHNGLLALTSKRNNILLLNTSTYEFIATLKSQSSSVKYLVQLQNERLLSFGRQNDSEIWDLNSLQRIIFIKMNYISRSSYCFKTDPPPIQLKDERLVYASDNTIQVMNKQTFELEYSFHANSIHVISLIQLKDGRLASGGEEDMIHFWDIYSHLNVFIHLLQVIKTSCS